jgi:hypothetical protein
MFFSVGFKLIKGKIMKKLMFVTLLLVSVVFAQSTIRLTGGVNIANIKWNDEDMQKAVDPKPLTGLDIGIEKPIENLILGLHLIQRGMKTEDFMADGVDVTMTMNYLNAQAIYSLNPANSRFSIFLGAEVGKFLNGEMEAKYNGETNTEDIESEDISLDYGAIGGVYFWLNQNLGLRASYYYGLANIDDDDDDMTGKHNGIQILLAYNFNF